MKSRERVRSALAHREPDRPPRGEIYIDDVVVRDTIQCDRECDRVGFEERYQFTRLLGLDIYCVNPVYPDAEQLRDVGRALAAGGVPAADQAFSAGGASSASRAFSAGGVPVANGGLSASPVPAVGGAPSVGQASASQSPSSGGVPVANGASSANPVPAVGGAPSVGQASASQSPSAGQTLTTNHAPAPFPRADDVLFPDLPKWSADTDLYILVMLDGPFGWGVKLLGFTDFLLASARQTLLYKDILERVGQLNKELITRAHDEGAQGILIADDIAYQKGLLVNPKTLRESYFPALGETTNHIKSQGLSAFFHSDGNLNSVIGDIIAAGFDGLQCIEKGAGMDIVAVKEKYGRHLCLWGNLDIAELMLPRTEGELKQTVRELISSVSAGGGYIFGTSSGLVRGINYDSMKSAYSHA